MQMSSKPKTQQHAQCTCYRQNDAITKHSFASDVEKKMNLHTAGLRIKTADSVIKENTYRKRANLNTVIFRERKEDRGKKVHEVTKTDSNDLNEENLYSLELFSTDGDENEVTLLMPKVNGVPLKMELDTRIMSQKK